MFESKQAGLAREIDHEIAREVKNLEAMLDAQRAAAPGSGVVDRRSLLKSGALAASSAGIAGMLALFRGRAAHAARFGGPTAPVASPYGEAVPTLDEVTGLPLLGLPPGFRYWSHGWAGDRIFPHLAAPTTPAAHDGMGVVTEAGGLIALCRNHEAGVGPAYHAGRVQYAPHGAAGTTNLLFDTRQRRWLGVWPTLSGTVRNCSGGITPHGTWLSCEESGETTLADPSNPASEKFTHGWVFEIPAMRPASRQPLKAMGRRLHEAAAVDPRRGHVYLTEDGTPGGVYRFVPEHRLHYDRGGRLEILKVVGRPNANLRGPAPQGGGGAPYPVPLGAPLDVEWVAIDDPENLVSTSNYAQGAARGAADFRRPEGLCYADGTLYWVSTDGGQSGNGQVFALDLTQQTLTLLYDAPSERELDNPDNLTVTPRGGLLFCEDNSGSPSYLQDGVNTERLVALTTRGEIFTFATNLIDFRGVPGTMAPYTRPNNALIFDQNYRGNEWAGATFDSAGDWLFVNIYSPGVTFAITGPWHRGPL